MRRETTTVGGTSPDDPPSSFVSSWGRTGVCDSLSTTLVKGPRYMGVIFLFMVDMAFARKTRPIFLEKNGFMNKEGKG